MSDELVVCLGILFFTIIIALVSLGYICAIIAVTKMEVYQKDDEKIEF